MYPPEKQETHVSGHEGVIVGCDQNQEWLLPWWWMNYCFYNSYPVTFVNFGNMSDRAISWCQNRAPLLLLDIEDTFVAPREAVDPHDRQLWESLNSIVWKARHGWFKKPFALLNSPYQKSVWIDLDCQIKGSIKPLFDEYLNQNEFAIVRELEPDQEINLKNGFLLPGETMYNTGVIAFKQGSEIIRTWAEQSITQNHLFMGDQQLLCRILAMQQWPLSPIPIMYNWPVQYGINPEAVILHWWGAYKQDIKLSIQFLYQSHGIDLEL